MTNRYIQPFLSGDTKEMDGSMFNFPTGCLIKQTFNSLKHVLLYTEAKRVQMFVTEELGF